MPVGRMFMSVFLFSRRRLAGVVVAASTARVIGYRSQEIDSPNSTRSTDRAKVLVVERFSRTPRS